MEAASTAEPPSTPGWTLYAPSVTLPLAVGASAALSALALWDGPSDRLGWLIAVYLLAIGLIVGAVIVYFLVGMWLIPASMIAGGIVLYSAHQALLYLPSGTGWASLPYLLGAVAGLLWGFHHALPRPGRPVDLA